MQREKKKMDWPIANAEEVTSSSDDEMDGADTNGSLIKSFSSNQENNIIFETNAKNSIKEIRNKRAKASYQLDTDTSTGRLDGYLKQRYARVPQTRISLEVMAASGENRVGSVGASWQQLFSADAITK